MGESGKMKKQHKLMFICFCGFILAIFMNCASKTLNTETGTSTTFFAGSGGIGGTLTVTDIPSEYNERYALFEANSGNVTYIRGYQSVNESTETTTLPQISNGKVSIPLWLWINDEVANVRPSPPFGRLALTTFSPPTPSRARCRPGARRGYGPPGLR